MSARKFSKTELEKLGRSIAKQIAEVDTDIRGNLFHEIGKGLAKESQFATGAMFMALASKYGIDEGLQ